MNTFEDWWNMYGSALKDAAESAFNAGVKVGYLAGSDEAKKRILAALSVEGSNANAMRTAEAGAIGTTELGGLGSLGERADDHDRKRAPRGLPRALTNRVLLSNGDMGGVRPQDIIDAAKTEYERMIAVSTIRSELRKGREDGRYQENNGLWSLTQGERARLESTNQEGDVFE